MLILDVKSCPVRAWRYPTRLKHAVTEVLQIGSGKVYLSASFGMRIVDQVSTAGCDSPKIKANSMDLFHIYRHRMYGGKPLFLWVSYSWPIPDVRDCIRSFPPVLLSCVRETMIRSRPHEGSFKGAVEDLNGLSNGGYSGELCVRKVCSLIARR